MWQCAEGHIKSYPAPVEAIDGDKLRQRKGRELRKYIAHRFARAALGGEQNDLSAWMA
jgi:hypothetical protein